MLLAELASVPTNVLAASPRSRRNTMPQRQNAGTRTARANGPSRSGRKGSRRATTDHDVIRRWAEERGAVPSRVRGTGGGDDPGMIRLDFPGFTGSESLDEIGWDAWFEAFDDNGLALIYQETTSSGEQSNFNKLVSRDTVEEGGLVSRSSGRGSGKRGGSRGSRSSSGRRSSKTASRRSGGSRRTGAGSRSSRSSRVAARRG
jgi:hypothetical protein